MNIAIIGAGDIGEDVAAIWAKKKNQIIATTHNAETLKQLSKVAQKCLILREIDENTLASLVIGNELLLITNCIDMSDQYEENLQMAHTIRRIALGLNSPRRLIYAGSTTIYGDHRGLWVDENSKLKIRTDKGKALIEIERIFLSLQELGWPVCILRIAEIYGPGRELSARFRSMQGRRLPGSGKSYSNMVHHADVVSAIDFAFRRQLVGIFNLSDDEHPTRQELYDQIAQKLGLKAISWDPTMPGWHGTNKQISNRKIKSKGFSFLYPQRVLD
jgi:nucleoside-diphosphate-sugar epimerase